MTVREVYLQLRKELAPAHGDSEAAGIARILLEDGFGEKAPFRDRPLSKEEESRLAEMKERLQKGEPVQYVVENAFFYGFPFRVNSSVLIPRPETEEMVFFILDKHDSRPIRVLDVGTGSGCIPIVLKRKRSQWEVMGIDVSEKALEVAAENARKLETAVSFQLVDFLAPEAWSNLPVFDLLVCNPPYIAREEMHVMGQNVIDYEPHVALFASGQDPLVFYRQMVAFSVEHLRPGGWIYMEVNEFRARAVSALFLEAGMEVVLLQDMQGKDRILQARKLSP